MRFPWLTVMVLAGILGTVSRPGMAEEAAGRWTPQQAWAWYERVAPLRGVNYVPSTAVNLLEWWQADTFDSATIDRELKWAAASGFNSVRCNLSFEVWEADPEGFKKRLDRFLDIAAGHKIGVMLCLFDDVNFAGAQPVVGKQPAPVPGVHNSRWVPSPAKNKVTDRAAWPALERYVKDVVGTFNKDTRVVVWDLYNEPGNGGLGEQSRPLVEATFAWARAVKPVQPLTAGPWADHNSELSKTMVELSDVISFHAYVSAGDIEGLIRRYEAHGRPILCTETIRRQPGKDFASVLPVFAKHRVSWYNWGLVAGKQQTYLPWEERGKTIQDPWHWDVLWPDGKPYDPKEIELIKAFAFPAVEAAKEDGAPK